MATEEELAALTDQSALMDLPRQLRAVRMDGMGAGAPEGNFVEGSGGFSYEALPNGDFRILSPEGKISFAKQGSKAHKSISLEMQGEDNLFGVELPEEMPESATDLTYQQRQLLPEADIETSHDRMFSADPDRMDVSQPDVISMYDDARAAGDDLGFASRTGQFLDDAESEVEGARSRRAAGQEKFESERGRSGSSYETYSDLARQAARSAMRRGAGSDRKAKKRKEEGLDEFGMAPQSDTKTLEGYSANESRRD